MTDESGRSSDEAFADRLLQALVAMALRSTRRQADLSAAMHGAGLPPDPARVRAALRLLQADGCIENLVPLSDGGLLLSVTRTALDRAHPRAPWLPLGEGG
jgi:hypothetical protein